MGTRYSFYALACLLLTSLLAACQSAAPATPPANTPQGAQPSQPTGAPPRPSATLPLASTRTPVSLGGTAPDKPTDLKGTFVYAPGDGSLWLQDANGANPRNLFKPTADTFAETPVLSPDGKQVAYALSSLTKEGLVLKDLRAINSDGTNARVLATPEYPKISFSFPAWSPDGKEVYFTQSYPIPPASENVETDRVSANGGKVTKAFDNARAATVSPDGRLIAFQRFDYKTFTASLWVANLDGSGLKELVDQDTFLAMLGARFGPDSKSILFSASGPPQKKLPGFSGYRGDGSAYTLRRSSDCGLALLTLCLIASAHADGLPWDLWIVSADGTKFEQMTKIGSDSPYPAWSPDGKYVAFFDVTGIYAVDREKKVIYPITSSGGHGGFDWR